MKLKNIFGRSSTAKTDEAKPEAPVKLVAHVSTSGKGDVVDTWLKQNIKGTWSMNTEGVSDDLQTKKYRIVFLDRTITQSLGAALRPSRRQMHNPQSAKKTGR